MNLFEGILNNVRNNLSEGYGSQYHKRDAFVARMLQKYGPGWSRFMKADEQAEYAKVSEVPNKNKKEYHFPEEQEGSEKQDQYELGESKLNEEDEEQTQNFENTPDDSITDAPTDAPTDATEEQKAPILEKEPVGQKGQDVFYYLKRTFNDDGSVKELLLVDAAEKQIMTAEEIGLKPDQVAEFVLKANEKEGLTLINIEIVTKYFMHKKELEPQVPNEEQPQEEMIPKEEAAIESPELTKEETSTVNVPGVEKV